MVVGRPTYKGNDKRNYSKPVARIDEPVETSCLLCGSRQETKKTTTLLA